MIQIVKGPTPVGLVRSNNRQLALLVARYIAGERNFSFTAAYRSDGVKTALRNDQHNKCCFSEAKFVGDDSHVEHFRPKGQVDEWPSGFSYKPGYYWLAYNWTNLFLCKSTINSSFKRNFFPLVDELQRNFSHLDTQIEVPLLVDPAVDNPRDHIKFIGDEPVGSTVQGKCTIQLLNLRSPELEEARRTRLKILKMFKESVEKALKDGYTVNEPHVADAINELRGFTQPHSEFSSMAIDFLSGWPHL
jgi:uncharacterized protein (TIGR02646 family)